MMANRTTPGRARRRATRVLLSCAVVAGALVLGLGAAGGTLALLSAERTIPGATITAGSLGLSVNGGSTATIGGYSISPGSPHARTFTVTNTGTVPVEIGATISVTSTDPIQDNMRARVTAVADSAECTPDLRGTRGDLNGYTVSEVAEIPSGQTATVCLELALDDATPLSQAGQSAAFTLTVNGTQKGR